MGNTREALHKKDVFENRTDAGKRLAKQLVFYQFEKPVVLAIPRGGVPVGFEIAKKLKAPFSVLITRKIGSPFQKEFGVGAISEGDTLLLDDKTIRDYQIQKEELNEVISYEKKELKRRVKAYRKGKPLPHIRNKTVILVDDGLATGVTARAAILSIQKKKPKKIIFAAPVCSYEVALELHTDVDALHCLISPQNLQSIGNWYRNFSEISDKEVIYLLKKT